MLLYVFAWVLLNVYQLYTFAAMATINPHVK